MVSFSINVCNKNFIFAADEILSCQETNDKNSFLRDVALGPEEDPEDECAPFKSGWTPQWR